jgi:anti-sigma regulatory factor (Ser/Thr protein kinase)
MTGLRHEACMYKGTDEFLRLTLPWIREGLQAGDPIIAVAHRANADALREALGGDAGQVDLRASETWYLSPARSFSGFISFAAAHPDAKCVRMIGEPIWPLDWETAVREYAHYEAVFNVIARDSPIWALCPYEVNELPDHVLDHAYSTHPYVMTASATSANDHFVEPDDYCAQLADAMSEPSGATSTIAVTADLQGLCTAIAEEAGGAGVEQHRVRLLTLAVHELATNALAHADGSATARTWTTRESFVCEVTSQGPSLSETTAGYVPIDPAADRGRGLWLVRQLCDLVEVRSHASWTVIRVHMRRRP